MEIQTTKVLVDYEGNNLRQPKEVRGADGRSETKMTDVTLRDAVLNLLNNWKTDEEPSGEDKAKSYMITARLFEGPTATLSIEDAAYIKGRAASIGVPLIMGQINEILENAAQLEQEDKAPQTEKDKDPKKR